MFLLLSITYNALEMLSNPIHLSKYKPFSSVAWFVVNSSDWICDSKTFTKFFSPSLNLNSIFLEI
ncbi:hypothetical protein [Mycoplasma zalophi]|uniref:hypothetical protein n=1 Tax=Mycoplasma zalophi TaxID=191287 RepID=UPI001C107D25|nr:hypothetical protein [Mycoplasma zalophi]MBU4691127.1 hypothetical protein [Mycoplasma zalophi]